MKIEALNDMAIIKRNVEQEITSGGLVMDSKPNNHGIVYAVDDWNERVMVDQLVVFDEREITITTIDGEVFVVTPVNKIIAILSEG